MGRIEELSIRYRNHISAPWQRNLAGEQKAIFVVYPKEDERKLRARLDLFEMGTIGAGHKWMSFNFTKAFATWMANTEYRNLYFESPEDLTMKLQSSFLQYAAQELRNVLIDSNVDEKTVVAVYGVASLYGFTNVSPVSLKTIIIGSSMPGTDGIIWPFL